MAITDWVVDDICVHWPVCAAIGRYHLLFFIWDCDRRWILLWHKRMFRLPLCIHCFNRRQPLKIVLWIKRINLSCLHMPEPLMTSIDFITLILLSLIKPLIGWLSTRPDVALLLVLMIKNIISCRTRRIKILRVKTSISFADVYWQALFLSRLLIDCSELSSALRNFDFERSYVLISIIIGKLFAKGCYLGRGRGHVLA